MAATKETNTHDTIPTKSWTLAPVTVDDMEALIDVHTAAFRSDLFSQLMLLGRPDGAHQALMRKSLEHWFADPRASLTKSVDSDGNLVAWACWVLRDDPAPAQPSSSSKLDVDKQQNQQQQQQKHADHADEDEKEKEATASLPETTAAAMESTTTTPATNSASANEDPARVLGGRMRADVLRRERAYMPRGTAGGCLVLQALATEPGMQGRGIACQLVRAGTERADAEGLPCWAHASPAGHALYARNGFIEVARDDYPLATWAPSGEGANRGWGTYTFRYMLRPVGGGLSARKV